MFFNFPLQVPCRLISAECIIELYLSYWHNIGHGEAGLDHSSSREIKFMSQKEEKGNSGAKGFASMDEERKKDIASQGGRASAQGKKTSNRGFASMDKDKQREISSQGGRASQGAQSNRAGRNGGDVELNGTSKESDAAERNLTSPKDEDSLESSEKTQGSLAFSETEENEEEGVGDGNLGRSKNAEGLGK